MKSSNSKHGNKRKRGCAGVIGDQDIGGRGVDASTETNNCCGTDDHIHGWNNCVGIDDNDGVIDKNIGERGTLASADTRHPHSIYPQPYYPTHPHSIYPQPYYPTHPHNIYPQPYYPTYPHNIYPQPYYPTHPTPPLGVMLYPPPFHPLYTQRMVTLTTRSSAASTAEL
jgi:hypothetical protein